MQINSDLCRSGLPLAMEPTTPPLTWCGRARTPGAPATSCRPPSSAPTERSDPTRTSLRLPYVSRSFTCNNWIILWLYSSSGNGHEESDAHPVPWWWRWWHGKFPFNRKHYASGKTRLWPPLWRAAVLINSPSCVSPPAGSSQHKRCRQWVQSEEPHGDLRLVRADVGPWLRCLQQRGSTRRPRGTFLFHGNQRTQTGSEQQHLDSTRQNSIVIILGDKILLFMILLLI